MQVSTSLHLEQFLAAVHSVQAVKMCPSVAVPFPAAHKVGVKGAAVPSAYPALALVQVITTGVPAAVQVWQPSPHEVIAAVAPVPER